MAAPASHATIYTLRQFYWLWATFTAFKTNTYNIEKLFIYSPNKTFDNLKTSLVPWIKY